MTTGNPPQLPPKKTKPQHELFNDLNEPRVFDCVMGYFIGRFTPDDPYNPIERLSDFMTEKEAHERLGEGQWATPELEIKWLV